jgi:hypothetical protein
MKVVYQTEDGTIFDTEEEAVEWETRDKLMEEMVGAAWRNTAGVGLDQIREVLEFVLAHYNVTPK